MPRLIEDDDEPSGHSEFPSTVDIDFVSDESLRQITLTPWLQSSVESVKSEVYLLSSA